MKSIREKAKEYGILNPNIHYDADGNTYNDIDKPSTDFEEGANYVLEQIEQLTNNQNWCAFPKQSHKELKELFEQLKK